MILGLYNSFLNNIEDIIDVVSIARIIPKDNPKNIASNTRNSNHIKIGLTPRILTIQYHFITNKNILSIIIYHRSISTLYLVLKFSDYYYIIICVSCL